MTELWFTLVIAEGADCNRPGIYECPIQQGVL